MKLPLILQNDERVFLLYFFSIVTRTVKMVVIGNKQNKKARNRLPQKKRRQWNVREKLMVVHFLENNGGNKRGTAKEFDIQPKQVHDWNNNKAKLVATAPHVIKLHPGKSVKYPSLENDLFGWVCEKRTNQIAVTQKMITNKAITLSRDQEFLANNPDITTFKFSSKWLEGFLARYDLCNRRRTTVSQQLPPDLFEK